MVINDFRHAVRMCRKMPMLTIAIVSTMALGIGAATTIFSVVRTVILKPLPFSEPDRLVWVAERNDSLNLARFSASTLNYLSWRAATTPFDDLGALGFTSVNLTGAGGEPEQLAGQTVTASVFPVLGLRPVAGRAFRDDDTEIGAPPVAMLSEALWRRRFGGDPGVIGEYVTFDGERTEVIGIVPPEVEILSGADVWKPLVIDPARARRLNHVVLVVGRLTDGVELDGAQAAMDDVAVGVGREFPEVEDWGIRLVGFDRWLVGDTLRTSLWVLFGAVGCVLLIACANVANLLLSKAVARERDMALRATLGASRGRLLAQLLVESGTLAALGGAGGLVLAIVGVRLINVGLPQGVLPVPTVDIDTMVLVFAFSVTILTGLLFGLVPAWALARTELGSVLSQGSRGSSAGRRRWLSSGLAVGELALATMLLVGAGLLGRTLVELQNVHLGFRPDHVLTFQLAPPPGRYPLDSRALVFYQQLVDTLRTIPTVEGAAISSGVPFGSGNYTRTPFAPAGDSILPPDAAMPIDWRLVSPDFFRTLEIPMVRGRLFTDADGPESVITIVSEATARVFWGDDDPIGHTLRRVGDGKVFTVVGVVGDVKNSSLSTETPALYYPSASRLWPRMDVVLRTSGEPTAVLASVRERVGELDPNLPISTVRTMEQWVSAGAAQPRLNATLLSVFSVVALVIAAIGVYGILAYSVNQRTREIGVRMALGASRRGVLALVLREGMAVALTGIVLGIAGALLLGRAIAGLVYGVQPRDPVTLVTVALTLAVVTLAACLIPAWRAARTNPLTALRAE